MTYIAMDKFPAVSRNAADILNLFGPESEGIQKKAQRALGVMRPILGDDLEFIERVRYVEDPTILGLSDGHLSVSVPFNDGLPYFQQLIERHPDMLYVGHAFTSADLFAFRNAGINLDITAIQDTIIWWYLTSAHLCKSGAKVEDGDGEKRGKGYMNLWSFLSVHTSLANHKECKGKECDGTYCPEHDPFGYNGIDAYGPLVALPSVVNQARMRGVDKLYPLHRDLAYVLAEMSRFGVQTDIDYIDQMETEFVRDKAAIEAQLPFNPKSNKEAVAYFKAKDIKLSDWQETTIREALEDCNDEELALSLDYKEMGNGTSRWFAPISKGSNGYWKGYRDGIGKVHPRLGMFTSTGRFQCVAKGSLVEIVRDVSKYPKGVPIEEVKAGDLAYAFDSQKRLVLRKVLWAGKVGHKKIVRLHWKGQDRTKVGYLDLTADHRVRLVDGSYRAAEDLKAGDKVMALSRGLTNGYARLWATGHKEISREHRFIFEQVYGYLPQHVHHVDHNELNNVPTNLLGLTHTEHSTYHFRLYAALPETILQRSERMKKEWQNNRAEMERKMVRRGPDNHEWLGLTKEWLETELLRFKGSPTALARHHRIDYETLQKYMARENVSWKEINRRYTDSGELIDLDYVVKRRQVYEDQGYNAMIDSLGMNYYRWKQVQEAHGFIPYNHDIISIEPQNDTVDVYDMEIEGEHNFIVNEICVHNCTSPNLQNVSKRRIDRHQCECGEHKDKHPTETCETFKGVSLGKKVRRAIIASPGHYLLKADFSNAENRMFLFLAGHTIPSGRDLHMWVAETMALTPEMEFCIMNGAPREAAKTAQHGSFYLEGIQLKTKDELRQPRMKQEIDAGVREVWWNWTFEGKIVTFTGANLAQRAFGDKSWENRKKAQAILQALFGAFPGARQLQKKIGEQIEKHKAIITPHGYYLSSFGPAEERMKTGAAMWGSNPISHLTKLALVDLWQKFAAGRPMRPALQVHDEILCEVRDDVAPGIAAQWLRDSMEIETPEIPGLIVPTDSAYGPNWRDCKKLK